MCTSRLPREPARRVHVAGPAISTCFTTSLRWLGPVVLAHNSPGNAGPPIGCLRQGVTTRDMRGNSGEIIRAGGQLHGRRAR